MRRTGDLDIPTADALVRRHLNANLRVTRIRKLYGGMVNRVCEFITDGEPRSLVAKLNAAEHVEHFRHEEAVLRWYRVHTNLPVPEPIAVIESDPEHEFSGLLMEKVDGRTLADARFSPAGHRHFQHDLARHLVDLHRHQRDTFGSALDDGGGYERWLDVFSPMIHREYEAVRDQLNSRSRFNIEDVLGKLGHWLTEQATPTAVHGDLWSTNVLIDDSHTDRPAILAFIDCTATYCDPEYELAYLRLFHTAGEPFFNEYRKHHPIRDGFDRRCRVYWLNTMMLHVRVFGQRYLPACEDLATQIDRLS